MNNLYRSLSSGAQIPGIGMGTFGSDKYSAREVANAVIAGAEVGYRHFDCASVYGNEPEVGEALQDVTANISDRESLWVTSKVWNDMHDRVVESCESSLRALRLDYLDLYLVHWPFPNHHGPGVTVDSRDPYAVPYIHDQYMRTWSQMETLVKRGLVRHIGTSNMTTSKLERVIRDAEIRPVANEMEIHPHFQQLELFDFCVNNDVLPIGYSPLGSPSRPERDRTPEDTCDTEDPVVREIADRLGVSPAIVCVLWQVKRGSIPIPFSVKRDQFEPMLKACLTSELAAADMAALATIDKNCRLIKGQVFLWQGAESWGELWID